MRNESLIVRIGSVAVLAIFLASPSSISAIAQDLPTPQTIVDKYVEAIGGEAAYKAVKNRVMKGDIHAVHLDFWGTITSYVEPPNAKRIIAFDAAGTTIEGVYEGVAWSGGRLVRGWLGKVAVHQADLQQWLNWRSYYASAETVGEEAIGDATALKVVFTSEEGDTMTHWFGKESGLLIQSLGPYIGGPAIVTMTDYKGVGGVLVAHKILSEGAAGPIEITFTTIEHNTEIEPSMFAVPESMAAQMSANR